MKKLAIIGSGDLGQQIAHHAIIDKHYLVAGYFDDLEIEGSIKNGFPVLGDIGHIRSAYKNNKFDVLMIGIGYKHLAKRLEIFERFNGEIPFGKIIHSTAFVDPSCEIGDAVFIYPGCILDMKVCIEDNVLLNTGCVIAHDSHIGCNSIFSPGVKIAGFVSVGRSVNLGIGTIVIDNINICDNIRTGAGAVIIDPIKEPGLYVGIPAKKIKIKMLPFNKPYLTGKETEYIKEAVNSGKISGNGIFTKKCHAFFEQRYGFKKCLLTTSCTDALEMAALLLNISPGDEVIMPSYTFVSTANAFVLRGAKIVFVDSMSDHPNMDADKIEELITSRTKVIVPVHYAGVACDMDKIMAIANKYDLFVVEDAAQAIDSYYISPDGTRKPLGSIGHLAAFSFHETKNIISGEGGMLVINDPQFLLRSEIIWEKGTNRSAFFRGEVDKYGWVDVGSSFLPSEIVAAFLYAQLENLDEIQYKRIKLWDTYYDNLRPSVYNGIFDLPIMPKYGTNNAHMFYLIFKSITYRDECINALKAENILSVFHYLSLHNSQFYKDKHDGRSLPFTDNYSNTLLRLPMYYELGIAELEKITKIIRSIN